MTNVTIVTRKFSTREFILLGKGSEGFYENPYESDAEQKYSGCGRVVAKGHINKNQPKVLRALLPLWHTVFCAIT